MLIVLIVAVLAVRYANLTGDAAEELGAALAWFSRDLATNVRKDAVGLYNAAYNAGARTRGLYESVRARFN